MLTKKTTEPRAAEQEIDRMVETAGACGEIDWYAGKREFLRIKDGRQLEVTTDRNNPGDSWPVAMHNVSDGGFAFWSKRKPADRSALYVREFTADGTHPWIPARVTHSTRGLRGFLVGASFV